MLLLFETLASVDSVVAGFLTAAESPGDTRAPAETFVVAAQTPVIEPGSDGAW